VGPARIDRDRLTTTLCDLINRPSVNPFDGKPGASTGERQVAEYLAGRFDRLGWHCEVVEFAPGRHNMVARRPGAGGRSLMLAGHMDTVDTTGYAEPYAGTGPRAGRLRHEGGTRLLRRGGRGPG
jgi:acetylornithine deacetylase/succinyl-diaminopimelate desuccinylase-like protein